MLIIDYQPFIYGIKFQFKWDFRSLIRQRLRLKSQFKFTVGSIIRSRFKLIFQFKQTFGFLMRSRFRLKFKWSFGSLISQFRLKFQFKWKFGSLIRSWFKLKFQFKLTFKEYLKMPRKSWFLNEIAVQVKIPIQMDFLIKISFLMDHNHSSN